MLFWVDIDGYGLVRRCLSPRSLARPRAPAPLQSDYDGSAVPAGVHVPLVLGPHQNWVARLRGPRRARRPTVLTWARPGTLARPQSRFLGATSEVDRYSWSSAPDGSSTSGLELGASGDLSHSVALYRDQTGIVRQRTSWSGLIDLER